jgi:hypothetical protein
MWKKVGSTKATVSFGELFGTKKNAGQAGVRFMFS